MESNKSILVGYERNGGPDSAVLIVGRKKPNQALEIFNAFSGEEATELWTKLTTPKEAKQDV